MIDSGSGVCHGPGCTGPNCVACKVYGWMEQLPPVEDRPPIKLTDWQIDMLHRLYPPKPDGTYRFGGEIGRFDGVPVERVDSVEESTPYQMAQVPGPLVLRPDVSPEAVEECPGLPSMDQAGVSTPGCDCGHEGMAAGWHLDTCAWLLAGTGAASPQVTPGEPPPPDTPVKVDNRRSGRGFRRLFGRTS